MANVSRFQRIPGGIRQISASASPLRKFKDPMADMTEEEKEQHRKEIRALTQKTFSIAYGIIGGAMAGIVSSCSVINAFAIKAIRYVGTFGRVPRGH